ncbi:MAG: 3-methyl-2-oxobutanoate hydroxymethyltransferase [Candidatus Omnitrophota bacterium]
MNERLTVQHILDKKKKGEKIVMVTAYDYPFAGFLDQAGMDMILVGDSLANVVLGLDSTREVGMEVMLHHTKAVNRAVKKSLLIGDMPYESYQLDSRAAVKNAKRFVEEAGCGAVKLEWFERCVEVTQEIIKSGIPVMGHIGLTPQTADKLGGFVVQGKEAESAKRIITQARDLQKVGCFSIVLECIPDEIAAMITKELSIPTIGIGAGVYCDGQVLVLHDLLGLFDRFRPKFVKQYVDLRPVILDALARFREEVKGGQFPDRAHSFTIKKEQLDKLNPFL